MCKPTTTSIFKTIEIDANIAAVFPLLRPLSSCHENQVKNEMVDIEKRDGNEEEMRRYKID